MIVSFSSAGKSGVVKDNFKNQGNAIKGGMASLNIITITTKGGSE